MEVEAKVGAEVKRMWMMMAMMMAMAMMTVRTMTMYMVITIVMAVLILIIVFDHSMNSCVYLDYDKVSNANNKTR